MDVSLNIDFKFMVRLLFNSQICFDFSQEIFISNFVLEVMSATWLSSTEKSLLKSSVTESRWLVQVSFANSLSALCQFSWRPFILSWSIQTYLNELFFGEPLLYRWLSSCSRRIQDKLVWLWPAVLMGSVFDFAKSKIQQHY